MCYDSLMAHYPGEKPKDDYEVDCAIEEWHDLSSEHREQIGSIAKDLHTYLGWSWEEYAQWAYDGTIPEE